jgi:hypothetical protein
MRADLAFGFAFGDGMMNGLLMYKFIKNIRKVFRVLATSLNSITSKSN